MVYVNRNYDNKLFYDPELSSQNILWVVSYKRDSDQVPIFNQLIRVKDNSL